VSAVAVTTTRDSTRIVGMGGLAALAIILPLWPTFASMIAIWNRDSTFTHGYFIPLLSGYLLWLDRRALAATEIKPASAALVPLAAMSVIWMLADFADIQVVTQAAAVAMIPLAVWLVLGTRFARRALFPLGYLLFAVPFGDFLVPTLVDFTTNFTVAAVNLVGVPIHREGTLFALPSGNFEVVKACSGVRYLIATIALGTLFAGLTYTSWRRRLAFMALCLVLPVVANGFRAFGIVMIAHYSELRYAVGLDHFIYGWVFFGLVIALLFWIGGKFSDRRDGNEVELPVQSCILSPLHVGFAFLLVGGTVAVDYVWRATAIEAPAEAPQLATLSNAWTGPAPIGDVWRPAYAADTPESELRSGRYLSSQGDVYLHLRTFGAEQRSANEATAALLIADGRYDLRFDQQGTHTTEAGDVVASAVVAQHTGQRWRVWRWYYVDGSVARSAKAAKLSQLRAWLRHRRPASEVVSIAVPIHDQRIGSIAKADQLLEAFVAATAWQVSVRS